MYYGEHLFQACHECILETTPDEKYLHSISTLLGQV